MSASSKHHALVIGASGLVGWSVVDQLLQSYPAQNTFKKVTALVNRPFPIGSSFWPLEAPERPDLELLSGVNLTSSDAEFHHLLQEKVSDVENITHAYYCAFKEHANPEEEVGLNVGMLRRLVLALEQLCPNFQSIVYPGGTRGYGIYRPDGVFEAPLTESLADLLPADYAKTVAYPHYRTMLREEQKKMAQKTWSWCEICPDAIIGFTPNGSGFSLAGHWAVYLYAWKLVHGTGAEVPFPGVVSGYDALYTETSAATLARVAIHASLYPGAFRERVINVADSSQPSCMRERWPQIAEWFGLKGVPPAEDASAEDRKPSEFIKEHRMKLEEAGAKGVDIWNARQLDSYGYWLTFDRHLSLERLREAGFEEEREPQEGWWEAFEMFKRAGMTG